MFIIYYLKNNKLSMNEHISKIKQYIYDKFDPVQIKIKVCIDMNIETLNLSSMGLSELPTNIPNFIKYLNCSNNNLKRLPSNLPNSIKYLNCSDNRINELPKNLPSSLEDLYCCDNVIQRISSLPNSLKVLFCYKNKIEKLPLNLPPLLKRLYCSSNCFKQLPPLSVSIRDLSYYDNKYLHIPKNIALRFNFFEIPNYNQKATIIQHIWRATKYKQIIIQMIMDNDNVLSNSFKSYGDLNIVHLITNYAL